MSSMDGAPSGASVTVRSLLVLIPLRFLHESKCYGSDGEPMDVAIEPLPALEWFPDILDKNVSSFAVYIMTRGVYEI
jgi:hypothetical protein